MQRITESNGHRPALRMRVGCPHSLALRVFQYHSSIALVTDYRVQARDGGRLGGVCDGRSDTATQGRAEAAPINPASQDDFASWKALDQGKVPATLSAVPGPSEAQEGQIQPLRASGRGVRSDASVVGQYAPGDARHEQP